MSSRTSARTYGLVARDAPVVVVFRRGPRKHVQLLRWDLRTDALEAGQWLKGKSGRGTAPSRLRVSDVWSYFAWTGNGRSNDTFGDAVLKAPEAHHGWRRRPGARRLEKAGYGARLLRAGAVGRRSEFWLVRAGHKERPLGELDWADFGPDGSLLFGREGRLFRQAPADAEPRLIADLTQHAFERVPPSSQCRVWPRPLLR